MREPTEEQQAIFDFIKSGKGNLLIGAGAGCAKTTTVLDSLRFIPQKSVLFCAFNKPIAEELSVRMPPCPRGSFWKAMTFHALGLKIVKSHLRVDIKPESTEELVNLAVQELHDTPPDEDERPFDASFPMRRAAARLLRTLKETRVEQHLNLVEIINVAIENDMFGKIQSNDYNNTAKIVQLAYKKGLDLRNRGSIDFCDMVWLPVVLNLSPPTRYQAVYVDEAQDLSLPQFTLVRSMLAPGGRLIAVGDLDQAIYAWRGAAGHAVWQVMQEELQATELPLTITWRCSQAVVRAANELVSSLRARPGAPEGVERSIDFGDLAENLKQPIHSFVVSRNNADLLHTAMYLWRAGLKYELTAGKEIVEPLFNVIDNLSRRGDAMSSKAKFRSAIATWEKAELDTAERAHAPAWADRIEQQAAMLKMMLDYAEPDRMKNVLETIIGGESSHIKLSTVHKVKGLEATRVFLLKQTFQRHRIRQKIAEARRAGDAGLAQWWADRDIKAEELNLEYVAITRAKNELVWVEMDKTPSLLTRILEVQARSETT